MWSFFSQNLSFDFRISLHVVLPSIAVSACPSRQHGRDLFWQEPLNEATRTLCPLSISSRRYVPGMDTLHINDTRKVACAICCFYVVVPTRTLSRRRLLAPPDRQIIVCWCSSCRPSQRVSIQSPHLADAQLLNIVRNGVRVWRQCGWPNILQTFWSLVAREWTPLVWVAVAGLSFTQVSVSFSFSISFPHFALFYSAVRHFL